ncbi:MAG: hypothetical protein IPK26_30730 [Planctomycetes bacterium]|nr:hypothetical protein [Planctomycetota bacterium]
MSTLRPIAALLFALTASAIAPTQIPQELLGSWTGTSEANRNEKLVIEKNAIVIADDRMPLKLQAPGVLVFGDGDDGERAEFKVAGDTLTLTIEGMALQYRRAGAAPKPAERRTDKPAEQPAAGGTDNPLAKAPAADRFARAFTGREIQLTLAGTAADGYRGTLVFRGTEYPAEAKAADNELTGRFRAGQSWFDFTANLTGDHLKLESGGATYDLDAPALPKAPDNPLAGGGTPPGDAPVPGGTTPPELPDVFAGKCERFDHPRGWFAFEMPPGWTVHSQDDTGMVLNPGLGPTDTLDAILGLMWGRLEKQDHNVPVAKVIESKLPQLRAALAEQGLTVGEPEGRIETFRGKDVPGAVLVLRGQTQNGQAVQVWFGGIAKRDAWISVSGVLLASAEAKYLPKLKRIFTSLEPKPPERNAKAEAALAGVTFASVQSGRVVKSSHAATYAFGAGGSVTRRLMSNVSTEPGMPGVMTDAETTGNYEVCGDVLYLYFASGQETGQIVLQGGQAVAIRIGNGEYPRQ